jgi:hypothetical protein
MEDYKKMYLEQKHQALMLEMSLMQMRATAIEKELPGIEEELKAYAVKSEDLKTDPA